MAPKSFRYRDGSEAHAVSALVDGTTFDPLREINIVSIVFESMGPDSRSRATRLMQESPTASHWPPSNPDSTN